MSVENFNYQKLIGLFREESNWLKGLVALPDFSRNSMDLGLASASINILTLAVPLTLMQVYDRILPNKSVGTLSILAIGCVMAILLEGSLRASRSFVSNWMAVRFEHLVSCGAVESLLSSKLENFQQNEVAQHFDRFNAIPTLRGFYSGQIFQVILDLPFALLFLTAIFYLGKGLVFVPLITICLFLLLMSYLRKEFQESRKIQLDVNERRSNFILELLEGIHVIKAMTIEAPMMRRYESIQEKNAEANMAVTHWSSLPGTIGMVFSQITMFGIIGIGANAVIGGNLTVGGLTACTLLGGRALQPVQSIAGFWLRSSEAQFARAKLQEIARMSPELEEDAEPAPEFPKQLQGKIEMKAVCYRGGEEEGSFLLKDVNLEVEPKTTICIMGENATQTTALLYLIMGLFRPTEGEVFFDGINTKKWDPSHFRGQIAYLPQEGVLFKGSILDNIAMFDGKKIMAARNAAALLGLDKLVAHLPMGYETMVDGQSHSTLPSGLIQRISIARVFVVRPRVILFDRSNLKLDHESDAELQNILKRLAGKCTIILVTNKPQLMTLAEGIYEVVDDTLENLF